MTNNNINIFISSTFNDMQSERDIIRKQIVPKLKEKLANYHVSIQITDLRWGVNTTNEDEDKREAKVLHVCIDAIQNSKPYFIAILGERYGWVPSSEIMMNIKRSLSEEQLLALGDISTPKSVTEMEILLGAIGKQELLNHSFFCLRNPNSYKNMPSWKKSQYVDALSQNENVRKNALKLETLKKRIIHECETAGIEQNIIHYDAQWNDNHETGKFENLDSFEQRLYNLLYNDIMSDLEKDKNKLDVYKAENDEQNRLITFVESHTENFQGRKPLINKLLKFLINYKGITSVINDTSGYFLTGFSGCGKSSIFSVLYKHLTENTSQHSHYVLAHAAGITSQSVNAENMLAKWCRQMKDTLEDDISNQNSEYNWESNPEKEFQNLLSRIRIKGLQPIVLIDSLDSFNDSSTIKDFDFLPHNVPFICTTLPGYAENIIKKHPNYTCYNIDEFTLNDAKQVIAYELKKNFKELSDNLKIQLLNKRREDGRPAYESPLWLRMALDILMELGEDDFNRIHNITNLAEDHKIETYLSHIINDFPSDTGQLFWYFINMTCRYFNKTLTLQALTYISIAQYGIKEEDMMELIGKNWNQLDFVSLRYWMRNFIQCNNKDHRWFFTHAILRQTIIEQAPEIYRQCQNKFFKFLIENISEDEKEQEELVHQLIVSQEPSILYNNIDQLTYVFIRHFITIYNTYQEVTYKFIHQFIDLYWLDDDNDIILNVLRDLTETGYIEENTSYYDDAINLYNLYCSHFSEDIFLKNIKIVIKFFEVSWPISYYLRYRVEDTDIFVEFFKKQAHIYQLIRSHYGENGLPWSLTYTFYSSWIDYITLMSKLQLYKKQYHEEFCNNISQYIDEYALWSIHNNQQNGFYKKAINAIDFEYGINSKERIGFMQQIQSCMLKLIMSGINNDTSLNNVIEDSKKLINNYVNLFNSNEKIINTPLMDYLSHQQPRKEKPQENTNNSNVKLTKKNIAEINLTEMFTSENCEDEWIVYDFNEEDDNDDDLDDAIPTIDDIKALESKFDQFLKNGLKNYNPYNPETEDRRKKESQYYCRLAKMYLKAGFTEKGKIMLNHREQLLAEFIINIGDNYVIGSEDSEDIIKHWELLGKLGYKEEQLKQAEILSNALYHSFYHHEDGIAQLRIYDYLLDLYQMYGMTNKKIELLENLYEITIRNRIERRFNLYLLTINTLGCVRSRFNVLFKELKATNKIREAVITLERWINLCHYYYVDEEDSTEPYDLMEAYDMLASLYDGTPALIEGMKERNSVFLKDPYIMVCLNDKWGYINHEGQVVIPLIYSAAWKAEHEFLSVCYNGRWGYIDLQGNVAQVLENYNFKLDNAIPIKNGWGRIRMNGNWYVFHHITNTIIPIKIVDNSICYDNTNGLTKVAIGNKQDFILPDGKSLLFNGTKSKVKTPNKGVIVAEGYNQDDMGYRTAIYDISGNELSIHGRYTAIVAFGEQNLTPAKTIDDERVYVTRDGVEITTFGYDYCRPFACGMGAVCKEGRRGMYNKWGFVNEQGEEVVKPQYIDVGDFHEGLAWVCLHNGTGKGFKRRGGKFGFINTEGEMVIPAIYDDISSFYEGKALVWQNEKALYINRKGEIII